MRQEFTALFRAVFDVVKYPIALVGGILLAKAIVFPDYVHRYRLAIEVDTPDGLKRAANVIQIERNDMRWFLIAGRYETYIRANAVFLDLGHGKNVMALLAHGPRAEDVDTIVGLGIEAYLSRAKRREEDAWTGRKHLEGVRILGGPLIPTLVTFDNLDDPRTARVVDPDAFGAAFGAGYAFRKATVEMISVRVWPLNRLALTDPPVTTGLQQRLPWWSRPGRPAYQAHQAMKNGDRTGPSSPAENLFVRGE